MPAGGLHTPNLMLVNPLLDGGKTHTKFYGSLADLQQSFGLWLGTFRSAACCHAEPNRTAGHRLSQTSGCNSAPLYLHIITYTSIYFSYFVYTSTCP